MLSSCSRNHSFCFFSRPVSLFTIFFLSSPFLSLPVFICILPDFNRSVVVRLALLYDYYLPIGANSLPLIPLYLLFRNTTFVRVNMFFFRNPIHRISITNDYQTVHQSPEHATAMILQSISQDCSNGWCDLSNEAPQHRSKTR